MLKTSQWFWKIRARIQDEIGEQWELKECSIGSLLKYHGGLPQEVNLANGMRAWAFGSNQYVQAAVKNLVDNLHKQGEKLLYMAPMLLSCKYRPETDILPECGEEDVSYYHSFIRVLHWIVELGRVDIDAEVSMMSSHLAMTWVRHLQELYPIFAYLKAHMQTWKLCLIHTSNPDSYDFISQSGLDLFAVWRGDINRRRRRASSPHAKAIGSIHDNESICWQWSRRRYANLLLADWIHCFLLEQRTNLFEFQEAKLMLDSHFWKWICCHEASVWIIRGLHYKLRMGITVDEPAFVFGDNQSVLANTTNPTSTLKKKLNAIAYHFVREGIAHNKWRTTITINTNGNIADMSTKPLVNPKQKKFVQG